MKLFIIIFCIFLFSVSCKKEQETEAYFENNDISFSNSQNQFSYSKWPKKKLSYCFENFTNDLSQEDVEYEFRKAFDLYSSVCNLKFTRSYNPSNCDILISFSSEKTHFINTYNTTCTDEFKLGVLGHSFAPNISNQFAGDIHLYDQNNFSKSISYNTKYLYAVALHEIGHSVGLIDVNDPTSIMHYSYKLSNPNVNFNSNDIKNLKDLYGTSSQTNGVIYSCNLVSNIEYGCSIWGNENWGCEQTFNTEMGLFSAKFIKYDISPQNPNNNAISLELKYCNNIPNYSYSIVTFMYDYNKNNYWCHYAPPSEFSYRLDNTNSNRQIFAFDLGWTINSNEHSFRIIPIIHTYDSSGNLIYVCSTPKIITNW